MTKFLAIFSIAIFVSFNVLAASSTVGIIDDETGSLIIQILDNPNSVPPYDAAILWGAMKGTDQNKTIQSDAFEIKCNTLTSDPQKNRFGSCSIEVKASRLSKFPDGIGTLLAGAEAIEILSSFTGSENPDFPWANELRLADNKLLITADHPRKLFALFIKNELIP